MNFNFLSSYGVLVEENCTCVIIMATIKYDIKTIIWCSEISTFHTILNFNIHLHV